MLQETEIRKEREAIEKRLLNHTGDEDEYEALYREWRRRLAIERAIRDDQEAAARRGNGRPPRKFRPIPPHLPGEYPTGE